MPFLQRTLKNFKILPIIFGEVDPQQVAKALAPLINDQTLVIASSDLSHYYPDEKARKLDAACIEAICRLDVDKMASQEACGKLPVLTLIHLAKQKGWQTRQLDYRTSADATGEASATAVTAAGIALCIRAPSDQRANRSTWT